MTTSKSKSTISAVQLTAEWMTLTQKIRTLRYELEKAEKAKLNLFKIMNKEASKTTGTSVYALSKSKVKPDVKKIKKTIPKTAHIQKTSVLAKNMVIKVLQRTDKALTVKEILTKLQTKGVPLNTSKKTVESIKQSLYADKHVLKPEKNKFIYIKKPAKTQTRK